VCHQRRGHTSRVLARDQPEARQPSTPWMGPVSGMAGLATGKQRTGGGIGGGVCVERRGNEGGEVSRY
jgi:hypothetical protein